MKRSLFILAVAAVMRIYGDYSVTTNNGEVVFTNINENVLITDSYLKEDGIVSLRFYTEGNGAKTVFAPSVPSTYEGGTVIEEGQLYIRSGDSLGTGDVILNAFHCALISDGYDVIVPNKVVFNPNSSYAMGFNNGGSITLKSVGTTTRISRMQLGRLGAGNPSKAVLSLTGEDSEAVARIFTSGALDLTLDGGTVRASRQAQTPFFASATEGDVPAAKISTAGVAFDVAEGADTVLGLSPEFLRSVVTNLEDTVEVDDFEDKNYNGWTIGNGDNTAVSGVYKNGSAFDTSGDMKWTTSDGSYYLMLRVKHTASRKVTVPEDGSWRVVFDQGCRPEGTYSVGMDTVVKLGGENVAVFSGPSNGTELYAFKRFETDVIDLTAGEYDLEIALNHVSGDYSQFKSMNFDAIRLEKVEITEPCGTFVKKGAGTLRMDADTDGDYSVEEGRLAFESGTIASRSVAVSSGGELQLIDACLDPAALISVASGATLSFGYVSGDNLVANGSFENNGAIKDFDSIEPYSWTLSIDTATERNSGKPGLQINGGTLSTPVPLTSSGSLTVYLREHCSLSQSFEVPEAGVYRLSFRKGCRCESADKAYRYSDTMPLTVTIDGNTVLTSEESEVGVFETFSEDVQLSAGTHTIRLASGEPDVRNYSGAMLLIDDVRVSALKTQPDIETGRIDMASGSVLRLDNADRFSVLDFRVDGKRVVGGRGAATTAGITVIGEGRVRFGPPQNRFTIIVR